MSAKIQVETGVQQDVAQVIPNGDAGKDGSKSKAKAIEKFKKALDGRRKTWTYDWMLPLLASESEPEAVRGIVDLRSHISVPRIRARLHELQLKMVFNDVVFVDLHCLFSFLT